MLKENRTKQRPHLVPPQSICKIPWEQTISIPPLHDYWLNLIRSLFRSPYNFAETYSAAVKVQRERWQTGSAFRIVSFGMALINGGHRAEVWHVLISKLKG